MYGNNHHHVWGDRAKEKNKNELKPKCQNCINKQEQCQQCQVLRQKLCDAESIVAALTETLSAKHDKDKFLDTKNEELRFNYDTLQKRSMDITSKMADVLETKGELENLDDKFSNTKLSRLFEEMYDKSWVSLLEWFVEDLNKDEQKVIPYLSEMMKDCYKLCVRQADEQIRRFLFLSEEDEIPSERENANLYKCRRLGGQSEKQRDFIIKNVVGELVKSEAFSSFLDKPTEESVGKLERFFKEYTDYCWLMTISHPPMALNFEVVGEAYATKLTERFLKYTTQEDVIERTKRKGTILHVVWPSVSTKDGSLLYMKGSVITVDGCKVETHID